MARLTDLQTATIALLLLGASSNAAAYIDPGTGSMLVQSLLGAIVAALVFGRSIWRRVKGFFARRAADPPRDGEKPG